ncbi:MAG: hypothetical protein ACFFAE_04350 [Candidatus Hodarchaeota archaeon]
MTSLDKLISILKTNCECIAAIQNTPQNILFMVTSENFWQCLPEINRYNIKFRFLEERKHSLDIHLSLSLHKILFEVTFRIVDYSPGFFAEVMEYFPQAAVFIQEIKEE